LKTKPFWKFDAKLNMPLSSNIRINLYLLDSNDVFKINKPAPGGRANVL
jgi:hypothetical protein